MSQEMAMTPVDRALADWAIERLLPRLDNRMGNVLFIRACLPEVAIRLVNQGLFITVVEHDPVRLEQFMAPIRADKLDRKVSVDARSYDGIEYQASSYNVVVSWEGVPGGMEPALFFKKVRRELKAGSTLYLRVPLRLSPVVPRKVSNPARKVMEKLPKRAVERLQEWAGQLASRLSLPSALSLDGLQAAASTFLKYEEAIPLSLLLERVRLLSSDERFSEKLPERLLSSLLRLDRRLLQSPHSQGLASSSLLVFSKSLEFGKVFRI